MTDKKSIPFAILDNADGQLDSGVSATGTSFPLGSGEGANFPNPVTGSATSDGDAYTLNSTGIQALGVAENDLIYNMTKEEFAVVLTVSTDSITTTKLGNSAIWENTDVFVINPILAYAQKRNGTEITSYEKIIFHQRNTDTLVCTTGNRGFGGTQQAFDAGDHISIMVSDSHIQEIQNMLSRHARQIHNIMREALTIAGLKTFSVLPQCSATPSTGSDLVNKQYVDDNSGGAFAVIGFRSGTFFPRNIVWTDVIDSGNYKVYRQINGGGWVLISTVSHDVSDYTDGDLVSGTIQYKVEALDSNDVSLTSNTIEFKNTVNNAISDSEFGDSSDGAYISGNLERGKVYQFSSFNLNTSMNLTGNGMSIIFVDGDFNMGASAVINATAGANPSGYITSMTIHGNVVNTSTGGGNGGSGGTGGIGWGGATGGAGGAYGTDGTNGTYGQQVNVTGGQQVICAGGIGGDGNSSGLNTQGGGGGGGKGGGYYYGANIGGNGGIGGTLSNFQQHLIVIVSGNVTISAGAIINGVGGTGGVGSNGINGGMLGSSYDWAGGGGGGGGSGGSNGMNIHFIHGGSFSNAGTANLSGGSGGSGVTGGAGRGAGITGNSGTSGSTGTITNIST